MSTEVLVVIAVCVFVLSGVMAMAGLGAAFLFVPLFYYLGVPLAEATPVALLLNVVSLLFATIAYWRAGLVEVRIGLPMTAAAVTLSPLGARLTALVETRLLLGLFAAFLVFAGSMMLFYRRKRTRPPLSAPAQLGVGVGVGGVAGFLGGLLGVGGGNFILPTLDWLGMDAKTAAGTTSLVVVFASFSGFLGHATLGGLDPLFLGVAAAMAAAGSLVGSRLMQTKVSNAQLKKLIGVLLWVIAAKMLVDLV